jgi:hypothetical protein
VGLRVNVRVEAQRDRGFHLALAGSSSSRSSINKNVKRKTQKGNYYALRFTPLVQTVIDVQPQTPLSQTSGWRSPIRYHTN